MIHQFIPTGYGGAVGRDLLRSLLVANESDVERKCAGSHEHDHRKSNEWQHLSAVGRPETVYSESGDLHRQTLSKASANEDFGRHDKDDVGFGLLITGRTKELAENGQVAQQRNFVDVSLLDTAHHPAEHD